MLQKTNFTGQVITSSTAAVIVSSERLIVNLDEVELQLSGTKLKSKDLFGLGKSDPFIEIYKRTPRDQYELVYKTEVNKDSL